MSVDCQDLYASEIIVCALMAYLQPLKIVRIFVTSLRWGHDHTNRRLPRPAPLAAHASTARAANRTQRGPPAALLRRNPKARKDDCNLNRWKTTSGLGTENLGPSPVAYPNNPHWYKGADRPCSTAAQPQPYLDDLVGHVVGGFRQILEKETSIQSYHGLCGILCESKCSIR
jgi:hypothetical protein